MRTEGSSADTGAHVHVPAAYLRLLSLRSSIPAAPPTLEAGCAADSGPSLTGQHLCWARLERSHQHRRMGAADWRRRKADLSHLWLPRAEAGQPRSASLGPAAPSRRLKRLDVTGLHLSTACTSTKRLCTPESSPTTPVKVCHCNTSGLLWPLLQTLTLRPQKNTETGQNMQICCLVHVKSNHSTQEDERAKETFSALLPSSCWHQHNSLAPL